LEPAGDDHEDQQAQHAGHGEEDKVGPDDVANILVGLVQG